MNISVSALLTILGMMAVTYSTRLMGYFLLRNKTLSDDAKRVMEAAPGCVLIAVIAPHFVSDQLHELMAILITLWAASRYSMLPTVLIAMSSSALLGWLFSV